MPAETAPIRALRLHLGAHKTATTHLQKALHKHRAALRAADIDFLRPVELRAALSAARPGWLRLPGRAARAARAPRSTALAHRRRHAGDLRGEPARPDPRPLRRSAPTPGSRRAWRRWRSSPARRRSTLFLAIRAVRPALALGARRGAAPPSARPRPHRAAAPHRPRRPAELVDIAARLAPRLPARRRLRVWRYEDHEAHWRRLRRRLPRRRHRAHPRRHPAEALDVALGRRRAAGRGGDRPRPPPRGRRRSTPPTRPAAARPSRPSTPRRPRRCADATPTTSPRSARRARASPATATSRTAGD